MNTGHETSTAATKRAERVLAKHGVPEERFTKNQAPRARIAIDAIIRDVKAANAEGDE